MFVEKGRIVCLREELLEGCYLIDLILDLSDLHIFLIFFRRGHGNKGLTIGVDSNIWAMKNANLGHDPPALV